MTRYPIEIFWSDEDEGFIAVVPDLPGCTAWGKTEVAAIGEAQDAIAAWIKAAKSQGVSRNQYVLYLLAERHARRDRAA